MCVSHAIFIIIVIKVACVVLVIGYIKKCQDYGNLLKIYNMQIKNVNSKNFNHVMIDLETMGNDSYSSIVSIGAVNFDIETGETGKEFYIDVSFQSCIDFGLGINASTIIWWLGQNEEARQKLSNFIESCGGKDVQVWGNSARFDMGLLQNAYQKIKIPYPWDFRKERCVRTLLALKPEAKKAVPNVGVAHDPVDDCLFQIRYCVEVWKSLNHE